MHLFTKLNEATYLTTLKKRSELKFLERVKTRLLEEGNDCRIVYSNSFLANIRKTWLVAKSYGESLLFFLYYKQRNLILSYSGTKARGARLAT